MKARKAFWGLILPLAMLIVAMPPAPVKAQGPDGNGWIVSAGGGLTIYELCADGVQLTIGNLILQDQRSAVQIAVNGQVVTGPTTSLPQTYEDVTVDWAYEYGVEMRITYPLRRWSTADVRSRYTRCNDVPTPPTPTIAVPSSAACSSHTGWTQLSNPGPGPRKLYHATYGSLEVNPFGEWRWVAPNVYGTPTWGRTPQGCKQSGIVHPDYGTVAGIVIQNNGTENVLFIQDDSGWTVTK